MDMTPDSLVALLHMTTDLRAYLLSVVTDQELATRIPGNPSLGELCREHGNVERDYLESFKTGTHTALTDREMRPEFAGSVDTIKAWYAQLDAEFEATLRAIPAPELDSRTIDRAGRPIALVAHFHTYREAILIFCAQAMLYLRMLNKPLNAQWLDWIG